MLLRHVIMDVLCGKINLSVSVLLHVTCTVAEIEPRKGIFQLMHYFLVTFSCSTVAIIQKLVVIYTHTGDNPV